MFRFPVSIILTSLHSVYERKAQIIPGVWTRPGSPDSFLYLTACYLTTVGTNASMIPTTNEARRAPSMLTFMPGTKNWAT